MTKLKKSLEIDFNARCEKYLDQLREKPTASVLREVLEKSLRSDAYSLEGMVRDTLEHVVGFMSAVTRIGIAKDATLRPLLLVLEDLLKLQVNPNVKKEMNIAKASRDFALCYIARFEGQHERAFFLAQKSITFIEDLDSVLAAQWLLQLGTTAERCGSTDQALSAYQKVVPLSAGGPLTSEASIAIARLEKLKKMAHSIGGQMHPDAVPLRANMRYILELGKFLGALGNDSPSSKKKSLKPESIKKMHGHSGKFYFLGKKNPLYQASLKLLNLYDSELSKSVQLGYCDQIIELAAKVPFLEHELLILAALTNWLRQNKEENRLAFVQFRASRYQSTMAG